MPRIRSEYLQAGERMYIHNIPLNSHFLCFSLIFSVIYFYISGFLTFFYLPRDILAINYLIRILFLFLFVYLFVLLFAWLWPAWMKCKKRSGLAASEHKSVARRCKSHHEEGNKYAKMQAQCNRKECNALRFVCLMFFFRIALCVLMKASEKGNVKKWKCNKNNNK